MITCSTASAIVPNTATPVTTVVAMFTPFAHANFTANQIGKFVVKTITNEL